MKRIAYFLADAHLGMSMDGNEGREENLLVFLREVVCGAAHLFIVGDLFDFWIEYRHSIRPDYFAVLHELRALVREGTEVHYCLGNHEFAVENFLSEAVGLKVHPEGFRGTVQGRKLRVLHGDGLREDDVAGRRLRRVLRNRANRKLYKLLHPTIGVWLGELVSGVSRRRSPLKAPEETLKQYRLRAREYLAGGDDIVVLGHTHVPELRRYDEGVYCNTGAWIEEFPFARLEDGEISLWLYRPGQSPEEIPILQNSGE